MRGGKKGIRGLRENESVAIDPAWVLGVVFHDAVEQDVGYGRHSPRKSLSTNCRAVRMRAWETNIGAPGWPEFALKVASTCEAKNQYVLRALGWWAWEKLWFWVVDGGAEMGSGGGGVNEIEELTARSRMVLMASLSRSV
jgi:hypothetical protein